MVLALIPSGHRSRSAIGRLEQIGRVLRPVFAELWLQTIATDTAAIGRTGSWDRIEHETVAPSFGHDGGEAGGTSLRLLLRDLKPDLVLCTSILLAGSLGALPPSVLKVMDSPERAYRHGILPGQRATSEPPAITLVEEQAALRAVDLVLAGSAEDAAHFRQLGAAQVLILNPPIVAHTGSRRAGGVSSVGFLVDRTVAASPGMRGLVTRFAEMAPPGTSTCIICEPPEDAQPSGTSPGLPGLIVLPCPLSEPLPEALRGAVASGTPLIASRQAFGGQGLPASFSVYDSLEDLAAVAAGATSDVGALRVLTAATLALRARLDEACRAQEAVFQKWLADPSDASTGPRLNVPRGRSQVAALWSMLSDGMQDNREPSFGALARAGLALAPLDEALLALAALEEAGSDPGRAAAIEQDAALAGGINGAGEPPLTVPAAALAQVGPTHSGAVLQRVAGRVAGLVARGSLLLKALPARPSPPAVPDLLAWRTVSLPNEYAVVVMGNIIGEEIATTIRLGGIRLGGNSVLETEPGPGWEIVRSELEWPDLKLQCRRIAAQSATEAAAFWLAATFRVPQDSAPGSGPQRLSALPGAVRTEANSWTVDCRLHAVAEWSAADRSRVALTNAGVPFALWREISVPVQVVDALVGQAGSFLDLKGYVPDGHIHPAFVLARQGHGVDLLPVNRVSPGAWRVWGQLSDWVPGPARLGRLQLAVPHTRRLEDSAASRDHPGLAAVRVYATAAGDDPAARYWRLICDQLGQMEGRLVEGRLAVTPGRPLTLPAADGLPGDVDQICLVFTAPSWGDLRLLATSGTVNKVAAGVGVMLTAVEMAGYPPPQIAIEAADSDARAVLQWLRIDLRAQQ